MTSILEDAYKLKKLCDDFLNEVTETNKKIDPQLKELAEHYWGKS